MKQGVILGSRRMRTALRTAMAAYTAIGIPVSRLGFILGFQSGPGAGGREGLQPSSAWFEYAKLYTLAAKRVAAEFGVATVWSWGWGTFNTAGADPDKQAAACVYLWTRDPSLCDAPAEAGSDFEQSLTEGQIALPQGVQCSLDGRAMRQTDLSRLTAVTHDRDVAFTILFDRLVETGLAKVVARPRAAGRAGDRRRELRRQPRRLQRRTREGGREHLRRARGDRGRDPARAGRGGDAGAGRRRRRRSSPSTRCTRTRPPARSRSRLRRRGSATGRRASPCRSPLRARSSGCRPESPRRSRPASAPTPSRRSTRPSRSAPSRSTPRARRSERRSPSFARTQAYEDAARKRAESALNRTICLRDDLPNPAVVAVSTYLPFLTLSS